jgi:hypothetical protein
MSWSLRGISVPALEEVHEGLLLCHAERKPSLQPIPDTRSADPPDKSEFRIQINS